MDGVDISKHMNIIKYVQMNECSIDKMKEEGIWQSGKQEVNFWQYMQM